MWGPVGGSRTSAPACSLGPPAQRAPLTRTHFLLAVTRTRPRTRARSPHPCTRALAHSARVRHPRAADRMCPRPRRHRALVPCPSTSVLFTKFFIFVLTSGPVFYKALAQMASRRCPQCRALGRGGGGIKRAVTSQRPAPGGLRVPLGTGVGLLGWGTPAPQEDPDPAPLAWLIAGCFSILESSRFPACVLLPAFNCKFKARGNRTEEGSAGWTGPQQPPAPL